MLNREREVAWFWLLHAILLTIFVASLVHLIIPTKGSILGSVRWQPDIVISEDEMPFLPKMTYQE